MKKCPGCCSCGSCVRIGWFYPMKGITKVRTDMFLLYSRLSLTRLLNTVECHRSPVYVKPMLINVCTSLHGFVKWQV